MLKDVDKAFRAFQSFEEADRVDRAYYRSLTPKQRLDLLLELVRRSGPAAERFERVCRVVARKEG